jgi:hypothetical protein
LSNAGWNLRVPKDIFSQEATIDAIPLGKEKEQTLY